MALKGLLRRGILKWYQLARYHISCIMIPGSHSCNFHIPVATENDTNDTGYLFRLDIILVSHFFYGFNQTIAFFCSEKAFGESKCISEIRPDI